jgi:hypothetical protein
VSVEVITELDAIDHSFCSHYARLGDGDMCGCRLGFVVRQIQLGILVDPLNLIYITSCDRGLQPTVRIVHQERDQTVMINSPRFLLTDSCRGHTVTNITNLMIFIWCHRCLEFLVYI